MRHVIEEHDEEQTKPLTEPVVLILASLAREPLHGYALLQDIERLSQGRVRLSTGTLYGALRRLLEDDWIQRFEQADTSREKQAYRITAVGRKRLRAEIARLHQLIEAASPRLKAVRSQP